jgi:hypothetical protein
LLLGKIVAIPRINKKGCLILTLQYSVCNVTGDPIPGPRPYSLFSSVKFPWSEVTDAIEEVNSAQSYRLSMQLSREGLICGPSSGMALQGLFNVLQKRKDKGTLHDLASDNGIVACVFLCCDLPFQYLDDYFTKLGEDEFHPIFNEVCRIVTYEVYPLLIWDEEFAQC